MSSYNSINYKFCDPTVEDCNRKEAIIDGESCLVEILDPLEEQGTQEYTVLSEQWRRESKGFVVIYSITSRESFEQVSVFMDQVLRIKDTDNVPMIVVGNKCDLEEMREVSTAEGQKLACAYGASFKEASAKERVNVDGAFYDLVRIIMWSHLQGPSGKRKHGGCSVL